MTDEEMAEQFANNGYALGCTKTPFESAKEGFLAGLKAGRPQWHKVADGDLPLVSDSTLLPQLYPVIVAVCVNNNIEVYGTYWDRHRGNFDCLDKVIAWCELPTFDKE